MRPRRRYIAFEVVAGANKQDVYRFAASICKILEIDQRGIRIIANGIDFQYGLFRCIHSRTDEIKKIMARDDSPLQVIGVSGTIKGARRFMVKKSHDTQPEKVTACR
jgi:RNase P/RNase MRP subunit POP5